MTTLIAWAGVDQRRVSSLYIASDSRVSWGSTHQWDQGRKTFASRTTPLLFGYWGDVLFPAMSLPIVMEQLSSGMMQTTTSAFGEVARSIRRLWTDYPEAEHRDFGIVMATRRREGMNAVFELGVMTFIARTAEWQLIEVPMPARSGTLHISGSGSAGVRSAQVRWNLSPAGGTSRAVYSAFTDALASAEDPLSGGGPQLVGLRRIGSALNFGTFYKGKRYLGGALVTRDRARGSNLEWFNERFERVTPERGALILGGQRHERLRAPSGR